MYQQKKPRDYRSLWIVSLLIVVIGILLTFNMALLRAVGFVLLGVGAIGLIWSISNLDKWKDKDAREEEEKKKFYN
ncbi:MAG: hypothetical protein JXR52_07195 [Bacteroidales bacterium]|nr:hypothetical protein [Bacteroidales bacterium]